MPGPLFGLPWALEGLGVLSAGATIAAADNLLSYKQYMDRERLEQNRQVQNGLLKSHAAQMYAQPDRANLAQMQQQLVAEQNLNRGTAMQVPGEAFNEWKNRILQAERANLERTAEQGNGGTPTSFQQYQNQYR
jgi:hypothetical protein